MRGEPVESNISIKAGDKDLEFFGLELGPPSGIFSTHYARFCHKEGSHEIAHKVISLTTERVDGPERGGSFYDASYGVLVEQQTDTMILHNTTIFHGTTLHQRDRDSKTTDIVHAKVSLLVVKGLHKTYAEYMASKVPRSSSAMDLTEEPTAEDTPMEDVMHQPGNEVMLDDDTVSESE